MSTDSTQSEKDNQNELNELELEKETEELISVQDEDTEDKSDTGDDIPDVPQEDINEEAQNIDDIHSEILSEEDGDALEIADSDEESEAEETELISVQDEDTEDKGDIGDDISDIPQEDINEEAQNIDDIYSEILSEEDGDVLEIADSDEESEDKSDAEDDISDISQEDIETNTDDISLDDTLEETGEENITDDEVTEPLPKKSVKYILKTAAALGIITVVTAFVLAALNNITSSTIQERQSREKIEAVSLLFGDNIEMTEFDGELSSPVYEILYIQDSNNNFIGYCVNVKPKAFNGVINMLVAVSPDGNITGINILEMNETAGIGTQVQEDYFLEQFKGESDTYSIDVIGGATVSSRAVLNGVDEALYQLESAKIMRD